jgi:hypothetical protein
MVCVRFEVHYNVMQCGAWGEGVLCYSMILIIEEPCTDFDTCKLPNYWNLVFGVRNLISVLVIIIITIMKACCMLYCKPIYVFGEAPC